MTLAGSGARFNSINDVQEWAFYSLLSHGERAAPRNSPTRELLGASFVLCRPRARVVSVPARRWSLPLAIGEFCWHASGSQDVSLLEYYAPRWRQFADVAGLVRGSCYGYKIFSRREGKLSQWDRLIALIRKDPDTRRAVINLSEIDVSEPEARDVSCTSTLQALVRRDRLHVIVQMRSNDAVWGLPYDVFLFTMLQELLAVTLGLELGEYIHGAGSLHLYERHIPLARRVLDEGNVPDEEMPPMTCLENLPAFLDSERAIREGGQRPFLSPYWSHLADTLEAFASSRVRLRQVAT